MAKRKRQTQCRHCFVPGCTTGYVSVRKKERKASLFAVPDDDERRQIWQRSIPGADKPLTNNSVVCEAHFDERFIVRNYTHVINCETVEIPRGRPCLTADAIPTLFPNVLAYLSKKLPSKRRSTTLKSGAPRRQKRNLIQEDQRTVSTPPVTQCESHETLESMSEENLPEPEDILPISADESVHSHDYGKMSAFPLKLEGHKAIVIKEEPEDILPISADESVHSDDYGKMSAFPLKLEGHEAVVIKEEPEDAPPTPTDQSVQSDNSGNMSMYPLQLEGHGDNAVSVKIEPGKLAFLQTNEGLCSGASDSASSVQVHLGELWKDGHLRGIEVPYKILAMPTRADFRSEDSDRGLPSRLDLEGHWNNSCAVKEEADEASATLTCGGLDGKDARRLSVSLEPVDVVHRATVVVKEEPADVEWQSSDSKESSSSLSSQEQWDQAQQERPDRHRGHDCRFCPFSSGSKRKLTMHENTHTHRDKERYKCPTCSQVFQQKDCLLAHNKFHAREKPYKCDTCGKRFSWESTFSRHQNVHVNLKPFKCASCPRTFKLKHNLTKHLRRDDCNEADVWESTDGDERPFKCPSCPKAFRGFHHLTAHKITHSDKRPFKCSTCPKTFHFRYGLSEHERVHSGEKPFKCTLCDKAFRTSGHLTSHRLAHTGEKPFKCPTCPKAFGMQWRLTMHKKNDHISAQPSLRNLRISRCLSPEISGIA